MSPRNPPKASWWIDLLSDRGGLMLAFVTFIGLAALLSGEFGTGAEIGGWIGSGVVAVALFVVWLRRVRSERSAARARGERSFLRQFRDAVEDETDPR